MMHSRSWLASSPSTFSSRSLPRRGGASSHGCHVRFPQWQSQGGRVRATTPSFVIFGQEGKVLRLCKALYGLRQVPRAWNSKLDSTLKEMGFQQSVYKAAVYRRGRGHSVILVGTYVNDLIITGMEEANVTPYFKIKTKCSSYVSPGSIYHTYDRNVKIEYQCLYYIHFVTWNIVFTRRLGRLSRRAAVEHTNPKGNRPGSTQASRRNLHCSSPSHLHLLSSVTTRVSRLMVATQQVKGKT
jgi:hypothetical protein